MKYTYPEEYTPRSVEDQWKILTNLFPKLKKKKLPIEWPAIPDGAESLFVIPHWKLIGATYNDAVIAVLAKIKESRPFYNWRDGQMGEQYLRQTPEKVAFWDEAAQIVLMPAQFGQNHAGMSVKTVQETKKPTELLLGAYEVSLMLLTHPERLQSYDDLWIDCAGDEFSPDGDGVFSKAPNLYFSGAQARFSTRDVSDAFGHFGSASGFVPQPLASRIIDAVDSLTLDRAVEICKENGLEVFKRY